MIHKDGELEQEATVKEYLTVQKEGKREVRRQVRYYNLDVISSETTNQKKYIKRGEGTVSTRAPSNGRLVNKWRYIRCVI